MDQVKFDLSRLYHFKVFKGCLPQILLGPFLNTLTHIFFEQTPIVFETMYQEVKQIEITDGSSCLSIVNGARSWFLSYFSVK